jgi:hypothetical protein
LQAAKRYGIRTAFTVATGDSLFGSSECRAEFAKTMPESMACSGCHAEADGIAEATATRWTEVEQDPEATPGTTSACARHAGRLRTPRGE